MPVEIARCLVARGGHLQWPIVINNSMQVDGADYVKLLKSSRLTARLLCGKPATARPLAKTKILETLIKMRNEAYNTMENNFSRGEKEDLGLDVPPKRRRCNKKADDVPKTVELTAPPFGEFVGHKLRVLLSRSGPLCVELAPQNLEYLHIAVTTQISEESQKIKAEEDGPEMDVDITGIKGLCISKRRQAIRAYKVSKGKTITKYFKITGEIAADDAQRAAATAWLEKPFPELDD